MSDTQTTLRDTISQAVETVESQSNEQPEIQSQTGVPHETAEEKADRIRDEKGRFSKSEKNAAEPQKNPPASEEKPTTSAAPAAPDTPRPIRPSSWKKDYWEHWEKLDPKVAEYILQREQESARGALTYKQQAEQAAELKQAMSQFEPDLQRYGIKPTEWITNLGNAHRMLALGSPQDKVEMAQQLISDYGIPVKLVYQDQQGQWQFVNQQARPQAQQQSQAQQPQQNIQQIVQSEINKIYTMQEVERFSTEKDSNGHPLHPYLDEVSDTMAGLLQSGIVDDLQSAYELALKHPKHIDIYESLQQQQQSRDQSMRREQQQKQVIRARSAAVSPKSATPSAAMTNNGKQDLRSTISEAWDEVIGGRI
jgi:hypothetical protein